MTILDKIIAHKIKEVQESKRLTPISTLERNQSFNRDTISLATALRNSNSGIIAEHKRKSPSKSVINDKVDLKGVVQGYEHAGVCGISVLTDNYFFGGTLQDLKDTRAFVEVPVLRKEFIIDPYQVIEAKASGADVILLIAAALSTEKLKEFSTLANQLQLEVLLEVHNLEELKKSLFQSVSMIGVNNRDLKTFQVSLETSKSLSEFIPNEFVKVSESGISSIDSVKELKAYGFQGFLMGEYFMKEKDPGIQAANFINQL